MARIQFINTDTITSAADQAVEVHSTTCQHVTRYRRHPLFEACADAGEGDFTTAQEAFDDYNADFIAEDPETGAWAIKFLPCSGLVTTTTVLD